MHNYILANKAVEDLSDIWNHTFEIWSERQPDKYYQLLIDTCQNLADKRVSGKKYHEIGQGILAFSVGQHIIFYKEEKNKKVAILRILHSRMNIKNRIVE